MKSHVRQPILERGVPPDFGGKLNIRSHTPRASWQKVGIGRVIAYPSIGCNDATFCQPVHRATAIHPWPKSRDTPDSHLRLTLRRGSVYPI